MAGKAYTMREMRAIVEYLTDRKAYKEIKGRKMWMEYANTQNTTRTWQSLKETFLKRILPDLHNPYYKLSMDQVRSFRAGYDVAEREKNNRLEFRTASEDSSTNAESQNDAEELNDNPATTGHDVPPQTAIGNDVEVPTGEDIICAMVSRSRSSADTVVIENCYENAEDIQRALESPKDDQNEGECISYKDCITFEPMTPSVRELIEDFETESEASDKENKLNKPEEIAENTESVPVAVSNSASENDKADNDTDCVIVIPDTEDSIIIESNANSKEMVTATKVLEKAVNELETAAKSEVVVNNTVQKDVLEESSSLVTTKSLKLKKAHNNKKENNINKNETNAQTQNEETSVQKNDKIYAESQNTTEFVTAENNSDIIKKVTNNNKTDSKNNTALSTQNTGNTSADTILPNNQEALDESNKNTQDTNPDETRNDAEHSKKRPEKRPTSEDSRESKKQKMAEDKSNEADLNERVTPVIEINTDTPTNPDTAIILEKNAVIPETKVIEMNTENLSTRKSEEQFNALLNSASNTNQPCTSTQLDSKVRNEDNDVEIVEDKNPCLLSVSLYDESLKNTKYSNSDSDDEATPAPKQIQTNEKKQTKTNEGSDKPEKEANKIGETGVIVVEDIKKNDIVMEPTVEKPSTVIPTKTVDKSLKLQRERALANVFGFTYGTVGAPTTRKRQVSYRKRYQRRQSKNIATNSSEWTSESDSESYVSPPRGRRNRQTKKYLKPKSSRILQDPEEGMLYVIFGKNIYPLVKDGKHIKNFLTYRPDSGSDMEEESYWRQKYVEQKKRVDEFKNLLKETRETIGSHVKDPASALLPSSSRNGKANQNPQRPYQNENDKELAVAQNNPEPKDSRMVLKIASKNGLEYCLEGGWDQISSAMPQMVQMVRSEPNPNKLQLNEPKEVARTSRSESNQQSRVETMEVSSGTSTPLVATIAIDKEAHEKVNKIETEIFKQIEELEKEEQVKQSKPENTNVTKRRGRPRKDSQTSVASNPSPAKKARIPKTISTESKTATVKPKRKPAQKLQLVTQNEQMEPNDEAEKTTPNKTTAEQTETIEEKESAQLEIVPTKVAEQQDDNVDDTQQKRLTRRESLRLSKRKEGHNVSGTSDHSPAGLRKVGTPRKYDTDSSVSDIRMRSRKSATKETTELQGSDHEEARYMLPPMLKTNKRSLAGKKKRSSSNTFPVQENRTENSLDSTQGYQDSDPTPMKISLSRRKRKFSTSIQNKYKISRVTRRKSYPALLQNLSSDSNNSSYFVPLRRAQSTLNSEVYKTDSYQLLVPKRKSTYDKLERIDEIAPLTQIDQDIRHFNCISKDSDKSSNGHSDIIVDIASSSSLSLPLSPELSVVENLSISKEMIQSGNHPTINEIQSNKTSYGMDFSEYMISNLDVSVPLMDQQCDLKKSRQNNVTPTKNIKKFSTFSDSKLNKVCTVNLENLTLSESLDQKLRDLLLESTKKQSNACNPKENAMEVDETKITTAKKKRNNNKKENAMVVDDSKIVTEKKTRAKKRSSTPRKKNNAKKPKDPVIVEEHMESCSYVSRNSCPPAITFLSIDENANNCADVTLNIEKSKVRKKKDVIKVKIQRPTGTRLSKEKTREKSVGNVSTVSNNTDSGINETSNISVFIKGSDDSVDLIHNHSETCLLANECIGENSVEFVENSKSIISLSSTRQSMDSELQRLLEDSANISAELFNNNQSYAASEPKTSGTTLESPESVFHSPVAMNSSILTEDLSDDPTQPTKWYLLSEDDTNTLPTTNMSSYGANLKKLFPIACAVPDLSTISEMSKENEDNTKSNCATDGDSRNCDSQCLF